MSTVVGTFTKFSMWFNPGLKSLLHRVNWWLPEGGWVKEVKGSMDMNDSVAIAVENGLEGINNDGNNKVK